ncbi:MFS transporter [Actinomadura sp. HBU206391]|uniref:MFS transporter n=1 Tax=Actinomadura sp. HBU206391 TaxID=2731692 RepID=UPI00164F9226|nr:MFS transporter [Actinomadura sp. HBU206391]MBC6462260.1 MFS transporter [Actinomadura sp. HBU206391]
MSDLRTDDRARAGRREWIGLAVLFLPCLLISMDISVLFFALPFISAELEPTGTQQLWIMDIYGFVLAGMLITMGALGDRIGRRRLLMLGATAFSVASVIAAYSTSAEMLIITRALLGLAGATLMPSTLALIRNMFHDPQERKTAIAIWTGAITGGTIVGPIVGGFLLEHFWWGSAFLINVPAMALLLALAPVLLPEFRAPRTGGFDVLGAALSLTAVLPVIYGIKRMAVDGVEPLPAASVMAGLLIGVAFVHRQRTRANPLIDIGLFRHRAFSGSILINVIGMFCLTGYALFTTQYLQLVLGMRPFTAALWSLAASPAIMVAVGVAAVLGRSVRPAFVICGGLLVSTAGFILLSQVRVDSPLAVVLIAAGVLVSGIIVASTLTADMILTAAPPERAGSASALSETGSELGGALGMAILGSIGAAVYHHRMADVMSPGTSPEALHAARETLGGANAVAAQLPGNASDALLDAGRHAFTQGMSVASMAGAVLMAATAVVALVLLRRVQAVQTDQTEQTAQAADRELVHGPAEN